MASSYLSSKRATVQDFSSNFVNIDTLCTVYSETQKALGKKPTFKEKEIYKKKTKEPREDNIKNIIKPEDLPKEETTQGKRCPRNFKLHGLFDDSSDDVEDDALYLCEYCTSLGYGNKYRPDVCDTCTICQSCTEYDNDECSGCSYSRWRDGTFYRDKLTDSDLFVQKDINVFKDIKLDKKGGTHYKSDKFTVSKL